MSFSYSIQCDLCTRRFVSFLSFQKHNLTRHNRADLTRQVVKFCNPEGKEPTERCPIPKKLPTRQLARYKDWLSMVVERFNGAHHPKFEGKH